MNRYSYGVGGFGPQNATYRTSLVCVYGYNVFQGMSSVGTDVPSIAFVTIGMLFVCMASFCAEVLFQIFQIVVQCETMPLGVRPSREEDESCNLRIADRLWLHSSCSCRSTPVG